MTTDEMILQEAERWFRSKLRGETTLFGFEQRLFSGLAERQAVRPEVYIPKERPPSSQPPPVLPSVHPLPTTKPPPADIQRELLRLSKVDIVSPGEGPRPRPAKGK